jgi:hypothetical protein
MGQANYYGGLVFTNHALQRLEERQFPQRMVVETFNRPDTSHPAKQVGAFEYRKRFDASTVTVIAKQNERREWVVLSCWIDPPLPGTKDYKQKQRYHAYKKAGFWGKVWLTIRNQLGL